MRGTLRPRLIFHVSFGATALCKKYQTHTHGCARTAIQRRTAILCMDNWERGREILV